MQTTDLTEVDSRWQVDYSAYLDLGLTNARLRTEANKNAPDKPGFNKKNSDYLTQVQRDTLAIDAEIAACLAFGLDPEEALVLFEEPGGTGKHSPDIYGLVEVKRVPNPELVLKVYGKDITAGAPIVQVYVDHFVNDGRLCRTGMAYLLGWQDPVEDEPYKRVWPAKPGPVLKVHRSQIPYYFTHFVRRPMATFPSHIFKGVQYA